MVSKGAFGVRPMGREPVCGVPIIIVRRKANMKKHIAVVACILVLVGIGVATWLVLQKPGPSSDQPVVDQADSTGAPVTVEVVVTEEPTPEPVPEDHSPAVRPRSPATAQSWRRKARGIPTRSAKLHSDSTGSQCASCCCFHIKGNRNVAASRLSYASGWRF